jgi:hypothetical protein
VLLLLLLLLLRAVLQMLLPPLLLLLLLCTQAIASLPAMASPATSHSTAASSM